MPAKPLTRQLLRAIPPEAAELYQRLLDEAPCSAEDLARQSRDHLESIREAARRYEFIPLAMAAELAAACEKLLGLLPALDDEQQRHARAAVRYFIVDDDADSDTSSITGLDDDAEVLNAVLEALGKPEWKVELQ